MADDELRMTIWKYDIPASAEVGKPFELELPVYSEVLTIQMQHDRPRLWARVYLDHEKVKRRFVIVGTGESAPTRREGHYVGTFQMLEGALVWHLFELVED